MSNLFDWDLDLLTITFDECCFCLEREELLDCFACLELGLGLKIFPIIDESDYHNHYIIVVHTCIDIWPERSLKCCHNKTIDKSCECSESDECLHIGNTCSEESPECDDIVSPDDEEGVCCHYREQMVKKSRYPFFHW